MKSEPTTGDAWTNIDQNPEIVATKDIPSNPKSSLLNGDGSSIAQNQEEKESASLDVVMKDATEEKTVVHNQDERGTESKVQPAIKMEQDDDDDDVRMNDKPDAVSQSNNDSGATDGQPTGVRDAIVKEEKKDNSGAVLPPSSRKSEEKQYEQKNPVATDGADITSNPDEKHPGAAKSST